MLPLILPLFSANPLLSLPISPTNLHAVGPTIRPSISASNTSTLSASSASFVYHRLILSTRSVGAMLNVNDPTSKRPTSDGGRCSGQLLMMWSAVCSGSPHSHAALSARPHFFMYALYRPTPVRSLFRVVQCFRLISSPLTPSPGFDTWRCTRVDPGTSHSCLHSVLTSGVPLRNSSHTPHSRRLMLLRKCLLLHSLHDQLDQCLKNVGNLLM